MRLLVLMMASSSLLLAACGKQAAPATVDANQFQTTVAEIAGTSWAMTQAAVPPTLAPTETPVPSPTLEPTPTVLVLPTVDAASPTAAAASSTGTCDGPLSANPAGPLGNFVIWNSAGAPIVVSLSVAKTPFGDCGYRSYSLAKGQSTNAGNIPLGCYSFYALINDLKSPTHVSGGGCWNNPDRINIVVSTKLVKMSQQHP